MRTPLIAACIGIIIAWLGFAFVAFDWLSPFASTINRYGFLWCSGVASFVTYCVLRAKGWK